MVNGLAVLGWGVGGIEAEAAMLGQPISMLVPKSSAFSLTGKRQRRHHRDRPRAHRHADAARQGRRRQVRRILWPGPEPAVARRPRDHRQHGAGIRRDLRLLPGRRRDARYLAPTGRKKADIDLVETYAKAQGLWRSARSPEPSYTATLELDISTVEPSLAGPKRPQDRFPALEAATGFKKDLKSIGRQRRGQRVKVKGSNYDLGHGDVVIAAITSCTNTSNPPSCWAPAWSRATRSPRASRSSRGSRPRSRRDRRSSPNISSMPACRTTSTSSASILSATAAPPASATPARCRNRSRMRSARGDLVVDLGPVRQPQLRRPRQPARPAPTILASPTLVVAYAIAGNMNVDLFKDPLGEDKEGQPVYLADIWPSNEEIHRTIRSRSNRRCSVDDTPRPRSAMRVEEDQDQRRLPTTGSSRPTSNTRPTSMACRPISIRSGHQGRPALATARRFDHHRPHLARRLDQRGQARPATISKPTRSSRGLQLIRSRRGNHEVMMRGTFANIRLRNEMAPGTEGGDDPLSARWQDRCRSTTRRWPTRRKGIPLVVFAGKEYGTGSSRDWAAKGTTLARREGRCRGKLRAYSPLESRRHGRVAARVQERANAQVAQA